MTLSFDEKIRCAGASVKLGTVQKGTSKKIVFVFASLETVQIIALRTLRNSLRLLRAFYSVSRHCTRLHTPEHAIK